MRLTGHQDKINQSASGVADANDFAAKTAPRSPQGLCIAAGTAIESQCQLISLLRRAPLAFWWARTIVPSMQAKASFGSPWATTCAMIRSHTPRTVQRRNRR